MVLNRYENTPIKNSKLPTSWQSQNALDELSDFLQQNWEQRAVFYDDGEITSKQQFLSFIGQQGVKTKNYINREIYSVRGGLQYDGTDYYVYKFDEENSKNIEETVAKSGIWSKEKLDDKILESFEYNSEIFDIQNGYYHYQKVCRTSDEYKKEQFTDDEATGYEIGVYDVDKHILYYYWTSY